MRDTESSFRGELRAVRQADASPSSHCASPARDGGSRCARGASAVPALSKDASRDEPLLRILRIACHAVRARSPARGCADAGDAARQASGAASSEALDAPGGCCGGSSTCAATSRGCCAACCAAARSSGPGTRPDRAGSGTRAAGSAAATTTSAPGASCSAART